VDEEVIGKAYDSRLMRRLLAYLRPYRVSILLALTAMLAGSGLHLSGPLLTKIAVDRYLAPVRRPAGLLEGWLSRDAVTGLAQISLLYLLVIAAGFALDYAHTYLMQWTGQRAMLDLRRQLMEHLHRADLAFYDRNPVGRLVTRVTTDVDALNELLASGLITIIGDVLALTLVLAVMFRLSPSLTGLMLTVLPLIVGVTVLFRRRAVSSYRKIRLAIARINAYLQEHVTGMTVVQLFNRESKSLEGFAAVNRDHMLAFKEAIIAYGWFYPAVEFLAMLALALLLAYGGVPVEAGSLTLGVLVAFFQYSMRFFRPIQDLSEKYNLLQSAMAAAERIFGLLDTPITITAPPAPRPCPPGPVAIEFDHVWFAYQDEEWVLRDVSFLIEPGQTVAVVGHTGAGKTTLVSLLLRFYDVQRGAIRIGGVDIRELDPRELRRQFGVVLQDPHLFSGTIADNIRLGTESISEQDLERAVEQVNLRDFIEALPHGFAQPVRERGDGLSTGQKQLVSFARALAHNPRFLILDEATSSVDTETEFRVREALARLTEGRTAIIIAHRLSTIQRADCILVMHKGRLREKGTHQQLLAQRGIYWRLYQLQYKDQETRQPVAPEPQR